MCYFDGFLQIKILILHKTHTLVLKAENKASHVQMINKKSFCNQDGMGKCQ